MDEAKQEPAPQQCQLSFNDWKKLKNAQNQPKKSPVRSSRNREDEEPFFIASNRSQWQQPLPPPPPLPLRFQSALPQMRNFNEPKNTNSTFRRTQQASVNWPKQPNHPSILAKQKQTETNLPASSVPSIPRTNTKPPSTQFRVPKNVRNNMKPQERTDWVIKPQMPPPLTVITPENREEMKRMWRDYREAMKPFKNREHANAKRVIQRLGKRNISELDEVERGRLERAQEQISQHKLIRSEKAAQWMQIQEEQNNKAPQNTKGVSGNRSNTEHSGAQIYMRKSNFRGNNKPSRGRGGFQTAGINLNASWGGPNRTELYNSSVGYGNDFVSGGSFNLG